MKNINEVVKSIKAPPDVFCGKELKQYYCPNCGKVIDYVKDDFMQCFSCNKFLYSTDIKNRTQSFYGESVFNLSFFVAMFLILFLIYIVFIK